MYHILKDEVLVKLWIFRYASSLMSHFLAAVAVPIPHYDDHSIHHLFITN